jgi:hypothetical protein
MPLSTGPYVIVAPTGFVKYFISETDSMISSVFFARRFKTDEAARSHIKELAKKTPAFITGLNPLDVEYVGPR